MNKKPVLFIRVIAFITLALVTGLTGPALAAKSGDVPFWTDIINRLETLQNTVDNLSTEVDLQGVTQNWDKKLDATNGDANGCNSDRFTCLFGDTMVRDNETGLVWDRSPDITGGSTGDGALVWRNAIGHCVDREVGGRKGFHLPMVEQLASLVDMAGTGVDGDGNPIMLPDGHPFLDVQSSFWSATTQASDPDRAWLLNLQNGLLSVFSKSFELRWWCVRGGRSFDGNTHETLH